MSSREKILAAVTANKPALTEVPSMKIDRASIDHASAVQQFIKTLEGIGGKAIQETVHGTPSAGESTVTAHLAAINVAVSAFSRVVATFRFGIDRTAAAP